MKYYHDKQNKKIIFSKPLKKCRDGVKVYFFRNVDETKTHDYPVATANTERGQKELSWFDNYEITGVLIKQKRFLGIFGSKWKVIENGSK